MKSFYLILIALVAITVSCKKAKDGAPGPAGLDAYPKQGIVSGTLTFTDEANKSQTTAFNYQYFRSLSDGEISYDTTTNAPNFAYKLAVNRMDLKDSDNYIDFTVNGVGVNKIVDIIPSSSSVYFHLDKIINNKLYEFNFSGSKTIITNMKFDFTTNHLTFDFACTSVDCGVNQSGTVVGKVDVILNHSLKSLM
jgi:hypothetical protein